LVTDREADTTLIFAPPPIALRIGASPAPPMSIALARRASSSGAAAANSDHSTLYFAPASALAASNRALAWPAWSPTLMVGGGAAAAGEQ
jgi:hypothetical protein